MLKELVTDQRYLTCCWLKPFLNCEIVNCSSSVHLLSFCREVKSAGPYSQRRPDIIGACSEMRSP